MRTMYHGTTLARAERMQKEGLKPAYKSRIYITSDRDAARMYAIAAADRALESEEYKEENPLPAIVTLRLLGSTHWDEEAEDGNLPDTKERRQFAQRWTRKPIPAEDILSIEEIDYPSEGF